ncbi:oxaloacetate decarboxylase subunit gamma [Vibrio sp. SM6]|uniref:Probable oxaloacetate decarboxylase gamma chain n=1 Tax=Vibrio agarilyticus TaxID=2726741 RepID=A0A7X8YGY5_9VIBR|nr:oxaloacetate decarboxylase subunit gamma [Vibrio agarilyticus]NLS12817.1 oxaloacetate decarboxylase subunit gamma [Vibrio agarilyticus]
MTNIGSLLIDAAALMATGMCFVFLFLTILVYLVQLMSRLLPEDAPEPVATPTKKIQNQSSPTAVSPQVVAAISAAVHQHRSAVAK